MPSVGERPPRRLARQTLAEIVEPRYEELFALVRDELRRSGFEEVGRRRASCSPAAARKMEGAIELAEEVFHMPVRIGVPQYVAASPTWCATRSTRPASGCCSTRASNACAQLQRAGGGRCHAARRMKRCSRRISKAWFQGNF